MNKIKVLIMRFKIWLKNLINKINFCKKKFKKLKEKFSQQLIY